MPSEEQMSAIVGVVSALSTLLAVVVALFVGITANRLGRIANEITTLDGRRAQREFLYNQVEGGLLAVLALTSSAAELSSATTRDRDAASKLSRSRDSFDGRLRVLDTLGRHSVDTGDAKELLRQLRLFARVLDVASRATHDLRALGRSTLASVVFDGSDDVTTELLEQLAFTVHGWAEGVDIEGQTVFGTDGRATSMAFDGSAKVAEDLRENLQNQHWIPNTDESLRLVIPWIQSRLEWIDVATDQDGNRLYLHDGRHGGPVFDSSASYVDEGPWPDRVASEWLNSWPERFWSGDLDPEILPYLSPEDIAQRLVDDLRNECIDLFVELSNCWRAAIDVSD